jgi:hypothetical protein
MNRREILDREQRLAPYAGACAIAVPVLLIGANFALNSALATPGGLITDGIVAVDEAGAGLTISIIMRAFGFGLMAVPLFYLYRAAKARSDRVLGLMAGFAVLGPACFAVSALLIYVGQTQLANDFIATASAGGDIYTVFDDLRDDNGVLVASSFVTQLAALSLIVGMVYIPLQAMRVGLLTRFLATLGMALGVLTSFPLFPGASDMMLIVLALWFGWLGFLILDRIPRGRPPAWAAGEAIPWPRAGEQPEEKPVSSSSAEENGVVEGDAEELISPTQKDHSARRDRARKKKRKRRG